MTKEEAVEMLEKAAEGKAEREERLLAEGYPAYTTQAGVFGADRFWFGIVTLENCFRSAGWGILTTRSSRWQTGSSARGLPPSR